VFLLLLLASCNTDADNKEEIDLFFKEHATISCDDGGCYGFYEGPETEFNMDIAHQFSNIMAAYTGRELKERYRQRDYSRVDFSKIEMTTKGMNTGHVEFLLKIPFERVANKCDAFTSFDHVGGWGHSPALNQRKKELKKALLPGDNLHISKLKSTPEGLKEYWIQWRHRDFQSDCN